MNNWPFEQVQLPSLRNLTPLPAFICDTCEDTGTIYFEGQVGGPHGYYDKCPDCDSSLHDPTDYFL